MMHARVVHHSTLMYKFVLFITPTWSQVGIGCLIEHQCRGSAVRPCLVLCHEFWHPKPTTKPTHYCMSMFLLHTLGQGAVLFGEGKDCTH